MGHFSLITVWYLLPTIWSRSVEHPWNHGMVQHSVIDTLNRKYAKCSHSNPINPNKSQYHIIHGFIPYPVAGEPTVHGVRLQRPGRVFSSATSDQCFQVKEWDWLVVSVSTGSWLCFLWDPPPKLLERHIWQANTGMFYPGECQLECHRFAIIFQKHPASRSVEAVHRWTSLDVFQHCDVKAFVEFVPAKQNMNLPIYLKMFKDIPAEQKKSQCSSPPYQRQKKKGKNFSDPKKTSDLMLLLHDLLPFPQLGHLRLQRLRESGGTSVFSGEQLLDDWNKYQ